MDTLKTQHKKDAFIAALAECGNISHAAKIAEIGRKTHYRWLADDAEYAQAVEDAMEQAGDLLELEARRRATQGVEEPVFYKGDVCGTVQKYSDTLLIFLLKGAKPDKYADRSKNENTNTGDTSITVKFADPEPDA